MRSADVFTCWGRFSQRGRGCSVPKPHPRHTPDRHRGNCPATGHPSRHPTRRRRPRQLPETGNSFLSEGTTMSLDVKLLKYRYKYYVLPCWVYAYPWLSHPSAVLEAPPPDQESPPPSPPPTWNTQSKSLHWPVVGLSLFVGVLGVCVGFWFLSICL